MSHHGREYEEDKVSVDDYWYRSNMLNRAVELINAIANGLGEDGFEGQLATTTPRQVCDQWLEANGYECEKIRAVRKAKRLEQLNKEIERLQKEKEAL